MDIAAADPVVRDVVPEQDAGRRLRERGTRGARIRNPTYRSLGICAARMSIDDFKDR
jgi:hypothetical protein